jgi:hypothetical protein
MSASHETPILIKGIGNGGIFSISPAAFTVKQLECSSPGDAGEERRKE